MGAHRVPEYRAIHPFHKIPTLDHGDFRLYETTAILRYLDRMADTPALVPDDARAVARMDQMISITACYVAPRISGALSFPRRVAPMIGLPVDEKRRWRLRSSPRRRRSTRSRACSATSRSSPARRSRSLI
jgi:glutathione S-transferase